MTEKVSGADHDDSAPRPSRARTAYVYDVPTVSGAVSASDVVPGPTNSCCCHVSSTSPSASIRIS